MLKRLSYALCNIIFPHICLVCRKTLKDKNQIICMACDDEFILNRAPFCKKCGINLDKHDFKYHFCQECTKNGKSFYFDQAHSVFLYQGALADLICLFKYKEKIKLKLLFSQKMVEFIKTYHILNNIDIIAPIPLHPKRLRQREFNQAQILAAAIKRHYNLELSLDGLKRIHMRKVQSKLDRNKRFENIKGAFKVNKEDVFKNKNVLLIDDVFTTGATLSEAAKALKQAGAKKVNAFTLAKTN